MRRLVSVIVITTIVLLVMLVMPTDIRKAKAEITKTREQQIRINPRRYTVDPQKTDAVHIMDAYERLMERYMNTMESGFAALGAETRQTNAKINAVNGKMDILLLRIGKIEKKLGITDNENVQDANSEIR